MERRTLVFFASALTLLSVGWSQANRTKGDIPYSFPPKMHHYPSVDSALFELGRHLFYDPILSIDSTVACASCHQQIAAFSDANKALSIGVSGVQTTRNSMPLFNLEWYPAFMWDGQAATLEEQLSKPLFHQDEMASDWNTILGRVKHSARYEELLNNAFLGLELDSNRLKMALVEFERSLVSSESKYDRVLRGAEKFSDSEYKGFVFVNDQSMGNCLHCHTSDAHALGTTGKFSNNGLEEASSSEDYSDLGRASHTGRQEDIGAFRIPSFRNLAFTAPYMHDGRFETLEEVIDFYSDGIHDSYMVDGKLSAARTRGLHLSEEEKKNILDFLNTMNDHSFVGDPRFASPFN